MGKKKKQKKKPINWQELAISAVIDLINKQSKSERGNL